MVEEVKYLQGNLKDSEFQDKLLEELNPRETKRLLKIVTELVADGHTNLHLVCRFKEFNKYIWVKDCDIPEVELDELDACYNFDSCQPRELGGYWLSKHY